MVYNELKLPIFLLTTEHFRLLNDVKFIKNR